MRTSRIVIALEQVIIRCGAVLMTTHWDGVCLRESHIYRQDEFTRCESHPEFIGMTFAATPLMMQLLRRCQPRQHCSSAMSRRRENFPHCWPRRKKKKKKKVHRRLRSYVTAEWHQRNTPDSFACSGRGEESISNTGEATKRFWGIRRLFNNTGDSVGNNIAAAGAISYVAS